ncbi:MAG: DMT family protein [Bacteroidetes bacterium]|nr:DMT family protein [Bacteroidota bacterium]
MSPVVKTILLLICSNVFMTFAWYAHLKEPLKLDFLWAGLCMMGAVYFMFRGSL